MSNDKLVEKVAVCLEAFDQRLSAIDGRFVRLESHLADDAQATEESAKSLQKLQELYLSIDDRLEQLTAMLGNYVQETKRLRVESQQLISEVRRKNEACGG